MSKHKLYRSEPSLKPSKLPTHPIWRGIGCILIVVIPVISYFIASFLIDGRNKISWLIIPQDLIFAQWKDPYLAIRLLYAGFLVIIIASVLALLTFVLNRMFGPSKFGPYDVPPEDVKKIGR